MRKDSKFSKLITNTAVCGFLLCVGTLSIKVAKADRTPWNIHPCSVGSPALFEHDNFSGRVASTSFSIRNLRDINFTDEASSVCVPSGWILRLYEHDSFRGDYLQVNGDDFWTDLKRNRPGGDDWGDKISSVEVYEYDGNIWRLR